MCSYWKAKSEGDLGWFVAFLIMNMWHNKGDRGHVTCDTLQHKYQKVYFNPCNKTKMLSYWKAKSEFDLVWIGECLVVDMWQVTRDGWHGMGGTWHAAPLIPIVILSPCKPTEVLPNENKIRAWFGIIQGVSSCEQVTGETWRETCDTWHAAT